MTGANGRRRRPRGSIQELPFSALRIRVYGGIDPMSKRRLDLRETIPPGPRAKAEAEKVLTRLLNPGRREAQPADDGHPQPAS